MDKRQNTIEELFYQAKNGNIEAKKEIINHYTKYTIKIIENKYNEENLDKEKLLQAGINAIDDSINKYDTTSSPSYKYFSMYILKTIKYRLNTEAKFQQNLNTHNKQVQFCMIKALQGDYQAKEDVTKYYIRQIDRLIENKYNSEEYDKEELKQAGYLGLAIALKRYNENFNVDFPIYVKSHINRCISKEIKNQSKETINIEIENTYNDFISYIENKELIWIAINKLSDRYRKILFLYLFEGYSFVEIAKIYNLSDGRIQQIYKKSLEIIKQELTIQNEDKKIKKQSKSI